jgi:hypothetical protein
MSIESYTNFIQCRENSDKLLTKIDEVLNQSILAPCDILPLRSDKKDEHLLDKHFGIDCIVIKYKETIKEFRMTIQNKTIGYDWWSNKRYWKNNYPNFCQETINAHNTSFERPGEWTYLTSQLIFLGYKNITGDNFDRWVLLNTLSYKLKIDLNGGLEKFGKFYSGSTNGKSAYHVLSLGDFQDCIVDSSDRHTGKQQLTFL